MRRRRQEARAAWLLLTFLSRVAGWSGGGSLCTQPHNPLCRRPAATVMRGGDQDRAIEDALSTELWAEFSSVEKTPTEGDLQQDDVVAEDPWVDELPDGDWDEPSAEEGDMEVESVAKYLPLLMRKKYGDDWELLLADAGLEASLDGGLDPAEDDAPSYIDEVAHGEGEDEDEAAAGLPAEEELREMVAKQAAAAEEEEESEEEEGEPGGAPIAENYAELADAPYEEIAMVSEKMAGFVKAQREGAVELPEPFPASEWTHIFVTALTQPSRFEELQSTWANLRVLLAENFDDLQVSDDPAGEPDAVGSALRKARALYAATGQPSLSETTCCHVAGLASKPPSETIYRMDDTVSELITRMRPGSPSEREVIFSSAAAYVDGNATVVGEGSCSFPLGLAGVHHATIATSTALDDLFVNAAEELGLKFVGTDAFEEFYKLQTLKKGGKLVRKSGGSLLLKEKIMREATVLDASILKVSSFLNHMVDVQLMEACGEELAERLEETQPTKVLTVEATGLLPGMFVGRALQLPVVFARKSRQMGISDSYQTSYKTSTNARVQDLYVSTEYLSPGDRVIIVDDFLAGGTTADALMRVCRMAGAIVVGGGFLIEKVNDAGRAFLSGYQIPLISLATVEIGQTGEIRMIEEEASELSELQQEQQELDRLLDERGRINLDFTIGRSAGADPAAEAAMAEMTADDEQQRRRQGEEGDK